MVSGWVKWLFETSIHAVNSCSLLMKMSLGPSLRAYLLLFTNNSDKFGGLVSQATTGIGVRRAV